ncbi:two-component system, cell cycle response regulator [Azospirillaceae bacterium]
MAGKIVFAKKKHGEDAHWGRPWTILIVDDEPEVHSVTRLALRDVTYKERPLQFLEAYSAGEARKILAEHNDIALILLDVVMETDDAGLLLVDEIRSNFGNRKSRIVLRTGQPGQAPEKEIIVRYDINDYKAKTELTQERLFTTVVSALRSYDDIIALDFNRQGLERIVAASASLFQVRSMEMFASGVLTQVSGVLGCGEDGILAMRRGDLGGGHPDDLYVMAAAGRYQCMINQPAEACVNHEIAQLVSQALFEKRHLYDRSKNCLYLRTPNDREMAVFFRTDRPLTALDRQLLEVLCVNISIGLDNVQMCESLSDMNHNLERLVDERTQELDIKRLEAEAATRRLRGIIELAQDAIISVDAGHRITLFNPAAERMFGWSAAECVGQSLNILLPEDVMTSHASVVARFASGKNDANEVARPELRGRRRSGEVFPAEISISRLCTGQGVVLTAMIRDVTQRRAMEQELRRLAATDSLTGVSNRRCFLDAASQEFAVSEESLRPVSVLMMDVDYFKRINDGFGHAVGDQVLCALVDVCRMSLRSDDLIGRYGGEEFVILLPNTDHEMACVMAEYLRAQIAGTKMASTVKGPLYCSVSIGVASRSAQTSGVDDVLMAADDALYRAKAAGRNRVEVARNTS